MARHVQMSASQQQILGALQGAPQLDPFVLHNVRPTGKRLGGGAYGVVDELEMDGLVCAGKKVFDVLIDPANQGAQRVVNKYFDECALLSNLRHPHVVQFLGICFLPDTPLPVLVMERMHTSLHDLLEPEDRKAPKPNLGLPLRVSILVGVARGLVYLHNHEPVVIHRDLTAKNILLNEAMVAKIADMGNSRLVTLQPGQVAATQTQGIPGTLVYMPPEASDTSSRYGPSLDMFSFGHLCLFTAIQQFPKDLLPQTYYDPISSRPAARTEIERRETYFRTLHQQLGTNHPLSQMIVSCLDFNPSRRPTARHSQQVLAQLQRQAPDQYRDRLQLEQRLQEKDATIGQMTADMRLLRERVHRSREEQLERRLQEKDATIEQMTADIRLLRERSRHSGEEQPVS